VEADPHNPKYSLTEIDFYSHIPWSRVNGSCLNHRLSLRKNMLTQKYELVQVFQKSSLHANNSMLIMNDQNDEQKPEKVVAESSDLREILTRATQLEVEYWGPDETWNDAVCTHNPKSHAIGCTLWRTGVVV
jgi:hypothetical protein